MEMALAHSNAVGALRIGATLTIGSTLMPQIVKNFQVRFPAIDLQVCVRNTGDIEQMIIENTIDLALVEGNIESKDIIQMPIASDQLVLVCSAEHPILKQVKKGKNIPLYTLSDQHFIVRETGSGTRAIFENAMRTNEISWTAAWECSGSDIMKQAALEGLGIAVLSRRLVETEIETGSLFVLTVDGLNLKRQFSIVYHKNKYFSEITQAFVDQCIHDAKWTI
jgi:DNA-binding transcriptional LysR family regulator